MKTNSFFSAPTQSAATMFVLVFLLVVGACAGPQRSTRSSQPERRLIGFGYATFVAMDADSIEVTMQDGKLVKYQISNSTKFFDNNCNPVSAQQLIAVLKKGDDVIIAAIVNSNIAEAFRPGNSLPVRGMLPSFC